MGLLSTVVVALTVVVQAPQAEPDPGRIYGRVVTAGGERLEGYLRWDRNETHWVDFLDGQKEIPWAWLREAERLDEDFRRRRERERSITVLGVRISWDEDDEEPQPTSLAGVRFGHLRALQVLDDRRVRVTLKSEEELVLLSSSSDIGRSFRGLVLEDGGRSVELPWRDLERVDFMAPPMDRAGPSAARLHGTLRTRAGAELTGYVAWDMDEALTTDVLDGRDGGRDRDVPFGEIARIEPEGRRSARVTFHTGQVLVLSGTNDVNADNRGIEITDWALGRAIVGWGELESLTFHPPGSEVGYEAFDGGRALSGVVVASRGRTVRGRIRWDNDEQFDWELLDGRRDGVDYDIELARVRQVERVGSSAARVLLRDGRLLVLEGSNDVGDSNRGLFIETSGGETVLVRWQDVERVTFEP
jgi:hypothetical protein